MGARRAGELAARPGVAHPPGAAAVLRPVARPGAVRRRPGGLDRRRPRPRAGRRRPGDRIARPPGERPAPGRRRAARRHRRPGRGVGRCAHRAPAVGESRPGAHVAGPGPGGARTLHPPPRDARRRDRRRGHRGRRGRLRVVPPQRRRDARDPAGAVAHRSHRVGAGGRLGGGGDATRRPGVTGAAAGERGRAGGARGRGRGGSRRLLRAGRVAHPAARPTALPHRRAPGVSRPAVVPRRVRRAHRRAPPRHRRRVVRATTGRRPGLLRRRQRPRPAGRHRPRGCALPAVGDLQRPPQPGAPPLLRLGVERGDRLLQRGVPAARRPLRRRAAHGR